MSSRQQQQSSASPKPQQTGGGLRGGDIPETERKLKEFQPPGLLSINQIDQQLPPNEMNKDNSGSGDVDSVNDIIFHFEQNGVTMDDSSNKPEQKNKQVDEPKNPKKPHNLLDSVKSNGTNQGLVDLGGIFAQKNEQQSCEVPTTFKGKIALLLSLVIQAFNWLLYHINPCARPNKKDSAIRKMLVAEEYFEKRKKQILISHMGLFAVLVSFIVMEHKSKFERQDKEDDGYEEILANSEKEDHEDTTNSTMRFLMTNMTNSSIKNPGEIINKTLLGITKASESLLLQASLNFYDDDPDEGQKKSPIHKILLFTKSAIILLYGVLILVAYLKSCKNIMRRILRFQSDIALLMFATVFHLKLYWTVQDLLIFFCGMYLVLPNLVLIPMSENWKRTIFLYILIHFYPSSITSEFEDKYLVQTKLLNEDDTNFIQNRLSMIQFFYIILLLISIVNSQTSRHEEFLERVYNKILQSEYTQILEKMPEGILIIDKKHNIQFANEELRDVLNLDSVDKGKEGPGLYVKIFRPYNLQQELGSSASGDHLTPFPGQQPPPSPPDQCASSCLHTLIEDEKWEQDDERLYELEICSCEPDKDENRIYTQIRRLTIQFRERKATMLLIRNITHIINYEKHKNENKYQELLTGTMSHEMLTPLNTIINISGIIELKMKKAVESSNGFSQVLLQEIEKRRQNLLQYQQVAIHGGNKQENSGPQNRMLVQSPTPNFQSPHQTGRDPKKIAKPHSSSGSNQEAAANDLLFIKERQKMIAKTQTFATDLVFMLDYLHMVKSSANILQYLVKELIDINNIKQGRFTPNLIQLSIKQIVEAGIEIIDCYRIQARDKKIVLALSDEGVNAEGFRNHKYQLANLNFDRQRYQQILINLVQNGVKFTAKGSVELCIEVVYNQGEQHQQNEMSPSNGIQVKNLDPQAPSDCPECGLIVTRVKDTGIGMSKDVVEKLFKMFSLDNNPQSKRGIITTQGVGLGLSISKQLVENLGGKIKIETFPGMGTEVAFSVPFKCAECAEITKYHQNGGGAPLNQSNLNNALITPNANALMKSSVFVQAAYPQIVGGYQPNPPPTTILSDGQGLAQGESQSPIPNIPLHQRGETINSSKDNSTNQQLALLTPSSVPSTPFAQQQQIAKNVLKQQPFGGRIQSLFNNDKKRSNQFKAASGAVNSSIKMPYKNEENTIQQNEYIGKGDGPSGVGVGVLALHAQGSSTSKNKSMFHSMQPLANFQSASGQQGILNGPGGNWQQNNSVESSKQNFEIGGIQSFFNKPPANDARRQSQKYKVNLVFNQNSSTPQLGEKKDGFAKSFQVNKYVVQSGIHIGERPGNTFLPSHIKPSNNFTGDQFNGQHEFLFDPVNHPNKKEIVANTDQQLHILGQLHLCKQENSQNQYQASIYESHCETGNEIEEEKYDLEGGRGQKRLRVNNNRRINQQHYQDYFASVNSLHPEGENTQKYFGRTIWHANNLKQIGRVRFDWDEKLQQKEISDRSVFLDQHQTARDQSNDGISLSDNQWITPQYYNQQQIGAEGGAIQQSNQLDIERSLQPGHEFENSQDDVIPLAPSRTLSLQKHQKVISGGKMHVVRRQDYDEGTDIHKSVKSYKNPKDVGSLQLQLKQLAKNFGAQHNLPRRFGLDPSSIPEMSKHGDDHSSKDFPQLPPLLKHEANSYQDPQHTRIGQPSAAINQSDLQIIDRRIAGTAPSKNEELIDMRSSNQSKRSRPIAGSGLSPTRQGAPQGFGDLAKEWGQSAQGKCPRCIRKQNASPSDEEDGYAYQADILLVDDNIFNLIPLELMLKEYCDIQKCDKANNGKEALDMFMGRLEEQSISPTERLNMCPRCRSSQNVANMGYKLIFMDIQMPVMDGYEATSKILEFQRNFIQEKNLRDDDKSICHVVGVTSFTNEEAVRTCYQAGMAHVMHKPVNIDQIKSSLEQYYHSKTQGKQHYDGVNEGQLETFINFNDGMEKQSDSEDEDDENQEPLHNFQTFNKKVNGEPTPSNDVKKYMVNVMDEDDESDLPVEQRSPGDINIQERSAFFPGGY